MFLSRHSSSGYGLLLEPTLPRSNADDPVRSRTLSQTISLARVLIAGFVLPLVPGVLWWMQTGSAMHFRGWLNVEYLALFSVALLMPSWWIIAFLTADLAVSLIEPIAHLYYFSPADAIRSLQYLRFVSTDRLIVDAVVVAVYLLSCVIVIRAALSDARQLNAKKIVGVLIALIVGISGVDLAHGRRITHLHPRSLFGDMDIRRTPVICMPMASMVNGTFSGFNYSIDKTFKPLPSAIQRASQRAYFRGKPDVVLILVESWGLATDEQFDTMEMAPYASGGIHDRYDVERGIVPFAGGTTSGETRELCGDSHGRSSMMVPDRYFDGCWPARMKNDGYRTLAVHGFTPTMFNRKEWYQSFGFEESAFLPELSHDGSRTCDGAFPGACDGDVARWIGTRLRESRDDRPMFIHWVTLNSHLPVAPDDDPMVIRECAKLGIDHEKSVCSWFSRIETVHQSVASLASKVIRPTVFVVVGDHAPPFLQASARKRFSQTDVPYLLLVPKILKAKPLIAGSGGIQALRSGE